MPRKLTLRVRAERHPVPRPRKRITIDRATGRDLSLIYPEDGVVEVENSLYYRKRIAAGDLVEVEGGAAFAPNHADGGGISEEA